MRIVVLDPKLFTRRNDMKTLDILERRVELLERKVDAIEMEVIIPKHVCSPSDEQCCPGETCEVDDDCPDSPCCDDTNHCCEVSSDVCDPINCDPEKE